MGNLTFKPASGGELILQEDGGSAALTIDTDGDVNLTQDIYLAAGKGIYFDGGTTSVNYLGGSDAYEEGDFTMVVECASPVVDGNWPASSSRDTDKDTGFAVYTKIGNVCTVSTYFHAINLTDGGGELTFTGLPFNGSAQNGFGGGFASHQGITWNTSAQVAVRKESGDDVLTLNQSIAGGNWSGLDCPAVASTYIYITITYLTA